MKKSFFPSFSLTALTAAADTRKAKTNVQLHFTRESARVAQSHFRARHPPNWRCTTCRHPFALFRDYYRHFENGKDGKLCCTSITVKQGNDFGHKQPSAASKHMLFSNTVVNCHQFRLQKRAEIEHIRYLDECLSVQEKAFLAGIKAKTTFLIKQGRRDMLRLKNYLITRRSDRNKKLKEEGKSWAEIKELDIKESFEAFDTDNGGSIDATEFKEVRA